MDDPSVLQNITSFGLLRGASSLCNKTVRNLIHLRVQEDRTESNSLSGEIPCVRTLSPAAMMSVVARPAAELAQTEATLRCWDDEVLNCEYAVGILLARSGLVSQRVEFSMNPSQQPDSDEPIRLNGNKLNVSYLISQG